MADRLSKDFYYLEIAHTIACRSSCMTEHMGAVIVKNDEIISTGYNGAPRGVQNCCDRGTCFKDIMPKPPTGATNMECRGVHAPMNAIINASRDHMLNSCMYIYGADVTNRFLIQNLDCCAICKRMIINAGITTVFFADMEIGIPSPIAPYKARIVNVRDWVEDPTYLRMTEDY